MIRSRVRVSGRGAVKRPRLEWPQATMARARGRPAFHTTSARGLLTVDEFDAPRSRVSDGCEVRVAGQGRLPAGRRSTTWRAADGNGARGQAPPASKAIGPGPRATDHRIDAGQLRCWGSVLGLRRCCR